MLVVDAISARHDFSAFKRESPSGGRPRGITTLALAGLLGLLNSVACGSSSSDNTDASHADALADSHEVADTAAVPDGGRPIGLDASEDVPVHVSVDATVGVSVDAPADAPMTALVDATVDTSVDTSANVSVDAPVNASVDALVETSVDALTCGLVDGGGTGCPTGQICNQGLCQDVCAAGRTLCEDGVCHDLMTEDSHCGWCNSGCAKDKRCIAGSCTCIVPGTCSS
jgi:hypothetical protein